MKTNENIYYLNIFLTYTESIHCTRFLGVGAGNGVLLLLNEGFCSKNQCHTTAGAKNLGQWKTLQMAEQDTHMKVKALLVMADKTMITIIIGYHQPHLPPNPSLQLITMSQMCKRQRRRVESWGERPKKKKKDRKIEISASCLGEGQPTLHSCCYKRKEPFMVN